jgi:hypothetical protein
MLALFVACRPDGQIETPSRPATTTPVPSPTELLATTRTPNLTLVQPTRPTNLPDLALPLPAGWQRFGSEDFGIRLAAPRSWTDLTWFLRDSEAHDRFGSRKILLVDSQETSDGLVRGESLVQGAFIFGYIPDPVPSETDPIKAITEMLASTKQDDEAFIEPTAVTVDGIPGALVDISYDPLNLLPPSPQPLRFRLLWLTQPDTGGAAIFLLGAPADSWPDTLVTLVTVMESINLPDTRSNLLGHMASGELAVGALERRAVDVWTFNGQAGRFATITLSADDEDIDLTLTLLDSTGEVLESVDVGFAGDPEAIVGLPLAENGAYIIRVGEFFYETGRYRLSLLLSDEPQFGGDASLEFDEEIATEIGEDGGTALSYYFAGGLADGDNKRELLREDETHGWFFQGQAGIDVIIEAVPLAPNMDMVVWLLDPDMVELASKDEFLSGEPESIEYILLADGEYLFLVREFFGESGEYEIALNIGGGEELEIAGPINYGQTVSGELLPDKRVGWTFGGQTGDIINVSLIPTGPDRDLVIVLLDPAGNTVITIDASLSGISEYLINFALSVDGEWTIVIQEFFNEGSGYELTLLKES